MTTPAVRKPLTPSAKARQGIVAIFIGGILLELCGVAVAVSQHPSTSLDLVGTPKSSGSDGGYAIGLVLVGVGTTFAFIAVVAWGVMLGMRAAPQD